MPAVIRHVSLTLLALFILAVLCAVLIPYRATVAGREEKQLRKQTIRTLYAALERETSENDQLPQWEISGPITGPKGGLIDLSAYVINTNSLSPPKRKEHRIVIAEKTSRFPRSGLFYAIDEQGSVVAWRLKEYTNLLKLSGIDIEAEP